MLDTDAREVMLGLVRLTRRKTGVTLWLAVRPDGQACYSYSERVARDWYAEPARCHPA